MKHNLGLFEPDCTIAKIKEAARNIMSPYGLDSTLKISVECYEPGE